jgi:hypothetical protein
MNKLFISLLASATILLTGCVATTPQLTAEQIAAQERAEVERKLTISAIKKIEIFYPTDYRYEVVLAQSATTGTNMFGLLGALVDLAVDASKKGTYDLRSNEFTSKVRSLKNYKNTATETVKKTSELLLGTGREVKVTVIPAVKDNSELSIPAGFVASSDYAALLVRPLHDYIAINAYTGYKPSVTYEFKLIDATGKTVWTDKISQRKEDVSYSTYSGLLEGSQDAFSVLQKMTETVPTEFLNRLNAVGSIQKK